MKWTRLVRGGCGPRLAMFGGALLALLLAVSLLLGAAGCISARVHDSAVVAYEAAGVLRKASVPNPAYKTPEEIAAWERLWAKQEAALRAIAEETR